MITFACGLIIAILGSISELRADEGISPVGEIPSPEVGSAYLVRHAVPALAFGGSLKEIERDRARLIETLGGSVEAPTVRTYNQLVVVTRLELSNVEREAVQESGFHVQPDREGELFLGDAVKLVGAANVQFPPGAPGGPRSFPLTGKGVTIGIIDTGVDYTHPELGECSRSHFLAGTCHKVFGGVDIGFDDSDPMDDDREGYSGHGTHVASIAVGNGKIPGIAPGAKVFAIKLSRHFLASEILEAFEITADPNRDNDFSDRLDIVNASFGVVEEPDGVVSQATDALSRLGTIVVAANGNGSSNPISFAPAVARSAIAVGASFVRSYQNREVLMDFDPMVDEVAAFSSRNLSPWSHRMRWIGKPDLVAPGALVCAARSSVVSPSIERVVEPCGSRYHFAMAGTSMAAPVVAGAAALVLEAYPHLTPAEVKSLFKSTAVSLFNRQTGQVYDGSIQGFGRIQVEEAIKRGGKPLTTRLEAIGAYGTLITLLGSASGPDFRSYRLEYRIGARTDWIPIAQRTVPVHEEILGTIDSATVTGGNPLHVRLVARNGSGEYFDQVSIWPPVVPLSPLQVATSQGTRTDGVLLSWNEDVAAMRFEVYHQPPGGGALRLVTPLVFGTRFLDRQAPVDCSMRTYVVRAIGLNTPSVSSNPVRGHRRC